MIQSNETIIIGGGQAGMATSYYLNQLGRDHVILEKADRIANPWRNGRWDSFTFVTPNWTIKLPGAEYNGPDPDGFMPREQIVSYFEGYAQKFRLPILYQTTVESVEPDDGGYRVQTNSTTWKAKNVVIATGLFQRSRIPSYSTNIPSNILQISTSEYRNPDALPAGSVLVVGSGQSGAQIAEELYQAGRKVYLCVGRAGRVPRRYRGRDITHWLDECGFFSRTIASLSSPREKFMSAPLFTGKDGGHTLNLHQFYRDGVTLLGHLQHIEDGKLILAADLKENLALGDQAEANVTKMVDAYIARTGIKAPEEQLPDLKYGFSAPEILSLDLKSAGIGTIIWAMGYTFDFSLVHLPVVDQDNFPITTNCATSYPGLFFMGIPFLTTMRSGFLLGVGEDASLVARSIAGIREQVL